MKVNWLLYTVFLIMIICVPCVQPMLHVEYSKDGNIVITKDSKVLVQLSINEVSSSEETVDCTLGTNNFICMEWTNWRIEARLQDKCVTIYSESTNSQDVDPDFSLSTVFYYSGHLYGGAELRKQLWPIESISLEEHAYVTKDIHEISERYWITSDGNFFYIQPETPLFVKQNIDGPTLEFIAKNKQPYPRQRQFINNQTLCQFANAKEAHIFAVQNYLGKPIDIPDELMIRKPIWSTWARYKGNIDEKSILEYANQIMQNGFGNSQIEIDDMWETCYGSLTFDRVKFPDMKHVTEILKLEGFRVTLWVHPFIDINCNPYYEKALASGYFVKNTDGNTITTWWNGHAAIIDFTKPGAVKWWLRRTTKVMQENGIDSLKLDAGETNLLPQVPVLSGDVALQPNIYTKKFVETAMKFGNMVEVRVGFQTQHFPIFVRMHDKESSWTFDNGLPTLVTTLFQMNLAGYPFVLPDMIGGNGYDETGPPGKELFIRWLQANVFMPAIQYSYVPWDYDEETIRICKKYTELHEKYADRIIEIMRNTTIHGTPVNPPIWWIHPEDAVAQIINDEFLLGEDLLVAPVLEQGVLSRDIYLPKGTWQDMLRGERIQGPMWLRNYSVGLQELPYFELDTDRAGAAVKYTTPILCLLVCMFMTLASLHLF